MNRLDEFNAGPVPSPMPISVLTEPDSELSVQEPQKVEEAAKSESKADETPEEKTENKEPLYRETKIESSFEAKKSKDTSHEEEELDEDWMFQRSTKPPSRKVSRDSETGPDSIMDEVEKLQAKITNIPTELSIEMAAEEDNLEKDLKMIELSKKTDALKRKSTPAKGTYNPSCLGVLDQLGTSSCSKVLSEFPSKSGESAPSPIISSVNPAAPRRHYQQLEQSPKPPPLPLNLDTASRSPALKKAMMETSYGVKTVETLRNLRGDFAQTSELVMPRFTPAVKADKPKPVFDSSVPLPPPVMSAVLISPKERRSNEPSPREKKYATLSNLHSLDNEQNTPKGETTFDSPFQVHHDTSQNNEQVICYGDQASRFTS